jgi:hypothetical protein
MFIKLLLTLSLFITSLSYAGDEVGNGAGLYENRTTYIFQTLNRYINQSLKFGEFNQEELRILELIQLNIKDIQSLSKLVFKSQDDSFLIDGEFRLAYTGNKIGASINFNIDKLYLIPIKELNQVLISILVHEFGHLLGIEDHFYLDHLGNKVSEYSIQDHSIYYTDIVNKNEYIEVLSQFDRTKSDIIFYIKDNKVFDIGNLIRDKMLCDGTYHAFNFHRSRINNLIEGTLQFNCKSLNKSRIQHIQIIFENPGLETSSHITNSEE